LHEAAKAADISRVEELLADGASVEARDEYGCTPLHLAAESNVVQVIESLLAKGADKDAPDLSNQTPLHRAAGLSSVRTVRCLLAHGANIEARDKHGCTPLHIAAGCGCGAVVDCLLANGADREARDGQNRTPLESISRSDRRRHRYMEVILSLTNGKVDETIANDARAPGSILQHTLTCEKCGRSYVLGVNAICLTSEELTGMLFGGDVGPSRGSLRPFLTIDYAKKDPPDPDVINQCRQQILRYGPSRGWNCKACEHHNSWKR